MSVTSRFQKKTILSSRVINADFSGVIPVIINHRHHFISVLNAEKINALSFSLKFAKLIIGRAHLLYKICLLIIK